jgi:hypothetical protein
MSGLCKWWGSKWVSEISSSCVTMTFRCRRSQLPPFFFVFFGLHYLSTLSMNFVLVMRRSSSWFSDRGNHLTHTDVLCGAIPEAIEHELIPRNNTNKLNLSKCLCVPGKRQRCEGVHLITTSNAFFISLFCSYISFFLMDWEKCLID